MHQDYLEISTELASSISFMISHAYNATGLCLWPIVHAVIFIYDRDWKGSWLLVCVFFLVSVLCCECFSNALNAYFHESNIRTEKTYGKFENSFG